MQEMLTLAYSSDYISWQVMEGGEKDRHLLTGKPFDKNRTVLTNLTKIWRNK